MSDVNIPDCLGVNDLVTAAACFQYQAVMRFFKCLKTFFQLVPIPLMQRAGPGDRVNIYLCNPF
jgi:hypothetical protein